MVHIPCSHFVAGFGGPLAEFEGALGGGFLPFRTSSGRFFEDVVWCRLWSMRKPEGDRVGERLSFVRVVVGLVAWEDGFKTVARPLFSGFET